MGGHEPRRSRVYDWFTPPDILSKLGRFDLDPCTSKDRPWDTATRHFTKEDDGLSQEWYGRVWCNPPYGDELHKWLMACAIHGRATALIFARTETDAWCRWVWGEATAVLFIRGRLRFYGADGKPATNNAGCGSALVAYGERDAWRLERCGIPGTLIKAW